MNYLQEALNRVSLLEDEIDLKSANIEEIKSMLPDKSEEEIDFVDIIDPEAETEDQLEDSYIGKVILDCCVCHSKIYKNADEVKYDEEADVCNEGEECPFCYSTDGFTIVGQVAPYKEEEVKVEVEPKEDEEEVEVEEKEEEVEESLNEETTGQDLSEYQKWVDYDMDKYHKISDDTMEKIKKAGLSVVKDQYGQYEVIADRKDESLEESKLNEAQMTYREWWGQTEEDPFEAAKEFNLTCKKIKSREDETLYEFSGLVKDFNDARDHGFFYSMDYDVDYNESLKEGLENLDIETEHDKIHVSAEEKEDSDEEMIAPLEPEVEAEIENNSEEEIEAPEEESDEEEVDFTDFDETSFDNMGESYLKKVYENVDSFKTSSVKISGDNLIVEGVIKFNSGNSKSTTFKFTPRDCTDGKVRFFGENLQITQGKKAFVLEGKVDDKKLISESLKYNYQVQGNRIYGRVVNESELSKKAGTASNAMANSMDKLNQCKTAEDVYNLASSIIPQDKINEPKVKKLLNTLKMSKNLVKAQTAFTNFILKGDGLGTIRK